MAIPLEKKVDLWPDPQVDPYLRLAVALMETEPTNVGMLGLKPDRLELLAELIEKDGSFTEPEGLVIPPAYKSINMKYVTGRLSHDGTPVRDRIAKLRGQVARLKLAVRQPPKLNDSLKGMSPGAAPPWKASDNDTVKGKGVIVGIIDDGCALAHRHFLRENGTSRILYLWDQTEVAALTAPWKSPPGFDYGRELESRDIDNEIPKHVRAGFIPEREVHDALGYRIEDGSHGTHVMDVAAGNGSSSGEPGVASCADIIFVQIPKSAIGNPANSVLTSYLLDAIVYIFSRAADQPAVINISYGGYGGAHDGTSVFERAIDELLADAKNRAVVVSAGNGFDKDCHAYGEVEAKQDSCELRWMVSKNDPTLNLLEIWYDKKDQFKLKLRAPEASAPLEVGLGEAYSINQADKIVGWIFHRKSDSGNNDHHVLIALRPPAARTTERVAPAPPGEWVVQLHNEAEEPATFHAWIERDDGGSPADETLQSRFDARDAFPACTLGSFATGRHTIVVGAYNAHNNEVCRYSASGPTRDAREPSDAKPDVCAPAAEDEEGAGVVSAESLSGDFTPMNGTSIATPHVTGLVALVLEAAHRNKKALTADEIRQLIRNGASTLVDPVSNSRRSKALLSFCIGAGKVDAAATLAKVP